MVKPPPGPCPRGARGPVRNDRTDETRDTGPRGRGVESTVPGARPVRAASGRKAETQARILEAAIALFTTRGYERTSISSIAERAKVSRSAVFWHFGDKETLFQEAFRRMLVPFTEQFKANLEQRDARARLLELFDTYEAFVEAHRSEIEPIVRWVLESPTLRASLRKPLLALVDQFVQDVCESLEELVEDPTEAQNISAALVSLLNGNLILSFVDGSSRTTGPRSAGLRRVVERLLSTLPDAGTETETS
jgi:AcrR family transcriptional regulator